MREGTTHRARLSLLKEVSCKQACPKLIKQPPLRNQFILSLLKSKKLILIGRL